MRRNVFLFGLLSAFMVLCGCGTSKQKAAVSGKVMFNGNPLPKGQIYFQMAGEAPDILQINNGDFSGNATVGKNKIQINAYKEGKKATSEGGYKPDADEGPPKVNYIPPAYNAFSKITKEVTVEGPNQFTFEIKTKKK